MQDGKIKQTFIVNGSVTDYVLTFAVSPGGWNCSHNAYLVISVSHSAKAFSLNQQYGKETRKRYGHYLGSWGEGEPVNLVFQSNSRIESHLHVLACNQLASS